MRTVRHETVHYTAEEMAAKKAAEAAVKTKEQKRILTLISMIGLVCVFACATCLLAPSPKPAPAAAVTLELEGVFAPGTYIVGRDLQPGTYRGQAGSGYCYWARLSNLKGELSSIIANGNATGQFYVQVMEADFAIETDCTLKRMGD